MNNYIEISTYNYNMQQKDIEINKLRKVANGLQFLHDKYEAEKAKEIEEKNLAEETAKAEKQSKLTFIREALKKETYTQVLNFARERNCLALLAEEIESLLEIDSAKQKERLHDLLLEVYILMPPEDTEDYEKRCMSGIEAIDEAINYEAENDNNEVTITKLQRKRLHLYINLYQGRKNITDSAVDTATINNLLANPVHSFDNSSTRNVNSFNEMIVELAFQHDANKKELGRQKLNSTFAKQIEDINLPEEQISFLKDKLTKMSVANDTLCAQNKHLQKRNAQVIEVNTDMEKQLVANNAKLNILNPENENLRLENKKLAKQTQVLTTQNTDLTKQNNFAKTQNGLLQDEISKQGDAITLVKHKNNELKLAQEELKTSLQQKCSEIDSLRAQLKQREQLIMQLQSENSDLKLQLKLANEHIIRTIKNDIQDFGWKTAGHDKIDSKSVTSTAKKIFTEISTYEKNKDATADSDVICLNKIKQLTESGKNHNFLYRFFHRQDKTSIARYDAYAELIQGNIKSL